MATNMTAMDQVDSRPLTRNQRSLIGMTIVGNVFEFFDMFLIGFIINILLDQPGWHLTGFQSGVILAAAGLGTVIGSILWGRLADKIGRRNTFVWCIVVLVVFTALSAATPTNGWLVLAILRTGVGVGVGGLNITSIPYVQEFVPAKQRGLLSGLTSVFIPAGLFLGSLASKLNPAIGWRGLIGLGCLPILLLIWAHFVPESPRHLIAKGDTQAARKAYAWAMMISVDEVAQLPVHQKEESVSYGLILKKHGRALLIITLGSFCFIAGSFTVQSWGQSLLGGSFKFDATMVTNLFMLVSLFDLLGRLGSAWICDRIGRRWTMFGCGVLGGVGCILAAASAWVVTHGNMDITAAGVLFFIGILLVMTFGDGAFGILNAFGGEQFPNEVRSTSLGLGYGIGAVAKIFGPLLVGVVVGSGDLTPSVVFWPFVVFAVLLFCGAITYLFAKETKNTQLEAI